MRDSGSEKQKQARAKNLKMWKPGQTGNPGGRPRAHREAVDKIRAATDEVLEVMFALLRKKRLSAGDKIRLLVCEALYDRGYGRPPQSMLLQGGIEHTADGQGSSGLTLLLMAARGDNGDDDGPSDTPEEWELKLQRECRELGVPYVPPRLPAPARIAAPAPESALVAAEEPAPEVKASPAAAPAPAPAPAPEAKPEPEPADAAPAKPEPRPLGGVPAGFAEFAARREAERLQRPGGMLSREDAFPPDPPKPPEIVRLGRVPGSHGIRRL